MERLGSRIIRMSKQINELTLKVRELTKQLEEKPSPPVSIVGLDRNEGNKDIVYDTETGLWKTYAVYKDEPEE